MKIEMSLALCLLLPFAASAKDPSPKATLSCKTAAGVSLPAKDRPRLAEPISCAVAVATDQPSKSTIVTKLQGKNGPAHSGNALKDQPFSATLKPEADFAICVDFEVAAQIEDDKKAVLWKTKLVIKQDCKVKKIKADVRCVMERGGKNVPLPARDNPRLEGPIKCVISTADEAALQMKAALKVAVKDQPPAAKSGKTVADNGKYLFEFELAPDMDFTTCSEPLTLTGELVADNGGVAFTKTITVKQSCPE